MLSPSSRLDTPLLVGTVSDASALDALAAAATGPADVDVVEIRFDHMAGGAIDRCLTAARALEARGRATLLTIRHASEGGKWAGTEAEREQLYLQALNVVSWIDVELGSAITPALVGAAHAAGKRIIVSFHDFARTPPRAELDGIFARSAATGADIVKIATTTNALADVQTLIGVLDVHAAKRPLCVIGMGTLGQPLRVFLPAVGSALAYSYLDRPAAPGQLSAAHTADILRATVPAFAARRP